VEKRVPHKKTIIALTILIILVIVGVGVYWASITGPGPEKKPIRIGFSISLTGGYASAGTEVLAAYNVWKNYINEKGGLLGRTVEFVYYDDESDATKAATIYEKLITVDKVDLVLGPFSSPIVFQTSTVTEKYQYVMIEPLGWSPTIFQRGYKYLFLSSGVTCANASHSLYEFILSLPPEQRPKNYVVTVSSLLVDITFAEGWRKYYAPKLGLTELLYEEFPPSATDLTSLYMKVKNLNPDIVFVSCITEPTLILAIRTMHTLGITPKIIYGLDTMGILRVKKDLGDLGKHLMFDSTFQPTLPFPMAREFSEGFKKATGYLPETHGATSFVACQILEQAVEGTQSLDNNKIREYILTHSFSTIQGPMSFNEDGTPKTFTIYHAQWQENPEMYEIVVGPYKTSEPVYPFQWGG